MRTFQEPTDTTVSLKRMVETCERYYPKLWNELNWRNFKGTEKWNDPRRALFDLCTCFGTAERQGHKGYPNIKNDPYIQIQIVAAMQMLKNKVPIFFIEKELLKAVSESSLPHNIEWQMMKLPFESAIFIFPQNSFYIDQNKECPFLSYSRIRAGKYYFNQTNYLEYAEDTFAITTSSPHQNTNYFLRTAETIQIKEHVEMSEHSMMQLNTVEGEALNKFAQITLGLLMVMNARPELMESGKYIGKVRRSDKQIWQPNIIGRKYRIKRETASSEPGSHASPQAHWRRGHFREQPYGPERRETKTIWIEPTLIGAKIEDK